jgi:hypothetical protein
VLQAIFIGHYFIYFKLVPTFSSALIHEPTHQPGPVVESNSIQNALHSSAVTFTEHLGSDHSCICTAAMILQRLTAGVACSAKRRISKEKKSTAVARPQMSLAFLQYEHTPGAINAASTVLPQLQIRSKIDVTKR